jgi:CRISPR-associated exonuclease Cas4
LAIKGEDFNELAIDSELLVTGSQINYYLVCKRKLWLFSHHIEFENESELVKLGKQLHGDSYGRKPKEIQIGKIKIDFVKYGKEIHEIKRSRKLESAHLYQLLYYLYYMKRNYDLIFIGVLDYPLLRKRINVLLTEDKENEISTMIADISNLIASEKPEEPIWKSYCKSCAYNEFCWG